MKPLKFKNSHLSPETFDGKMKLGTEAANAYVLALLEITEGLTDADRDVFIWFSLLSMMERMRQEGIHLDLTELSEAGDAIVDGDAFQRLKRSVNEAIDRSREAEKFFTRIIPDVGAERSSELLEEAFSSISRNTALECMQIIEDTLIF